MARTSDTSVIGKIIAFDILPGSDYVYNARTGAWDKLGQRPQLRAQLRLSRLGCVRDGASCNGDAKKHKAAFSAPIGPDGSVQTTFTLPVGAKSLSIDLTGNVKTREMEAFNKRYSCRFKLTPVQ